MKIAIVKWRDAYQVQYDLQILDVPEQPECIKLTVGILVRDDKQYIGVAHELTPGDQSVSDTTIIPRGMVISVQKVKYAGKL
jgi:hypothetical protein